MFEFTKLMKFEAKVVVADDVLNEGRTAKALISREFAEKLGIRDRGNIKLTRGNSVCFEVCVSEFAEGVDVVLPSGYFACKLCDVENPKIFTAEAEKCNEADSIPDFN